MSRRLVDDPWRVFQIYALLLALLVALVGAVYAASDDRWSDDGRPVRQYVCSNCGVWQR